MVSPQPIIESHPSLISASTSSSKHLPSLGSQQLAPLNYPYRSHSIRSNSDAPLHSNAITTNNGNNGYNGAHHTTSQNPSHLVRSKYPLTSVSDSPPYLWDLYDLPASDESLLGLSFNHHPLQPPQLQKQSTNEFIADMVMPPQSFSYSDDAFGIASDPYALNYSSTSIGNNGALDSSMTSCERCWAEDAPCAKCQMATRKKQQQHHDWPMEDIKHEELANELHYASQPQPQPPQQLLHQQAVHQYHLPLPPLNNYHHQLTPFESKEDETEEKESSSTSLADLPPLSPPLVHDTHRLQGKLTRFLPDTTNDQQQTAQHMYATAPMDSIASQGRSLRGRRGSVESALTVSRASSPSLMEQDHDHDHEQENHSDYESEYTDQYEQEEDQSNATRSTSALGDSMDLDDSLSPPSVRYEDAAASSSSSGQSSAEPPQPTRLLPVAAKDLLPSRPSTAVIPPPHIKDRLVRSARKLLTAADGVNDSVQVQVIPLWFPSKHAPDAHKIRLIRVKNTEADGCAVSVYAHAADVGGVVERKSNISRLFGKFESPSHKLLMNVPGSHNHKIGQESNILTSLGVRKFLNTNKMKEETAYRTWIQNVLLPCLMHDPLEVATEILEIEASTDPNAPHMIKPKKLKRMEKKREKKLAEKKLQQQAQEFEKKERSEKIRKQVSDDSPSKRQKYVHTTPPPSSSPTNAFEMGQAPLQFTLGPHANARMSHAA